jgi:hypothetical protein
MCFSLALDAGSNSLILANFGETPVLGQPEVAEKSGLVIVKPPAVVAAVQRQFPDEEE